MTSTKLTCALLATSVMLSGCATVSRVLAWVTPDRADKPELAVRVAELPAAAAAPDPVARLYQAAVGAIEERDYGRSLELLQLARERAPNDARVLNALGVTYDKLGRFDLSARYYAEAAKAAPDSPVVAANMAYSQLIQRQHVAVQAQPIPAPELIVRAAAQTPPVLTRATPKLTGQPLLVVGAGGDGATVRYQLAALGWSVTRSLEPAAPLSRSRIVYPAEHQVIARALANTLPFRADLVACEDCRAVKLILGENAQWRG